MVFALMPLSVLPGCGLMPWMSDDARYQPDDPGLYVYQNDDEDQSLHRLDGDPDWELETWATRSNFGPNIEFVIYQSSLPKVANTPEQAIRLRKVSWVRSDIGDDGRILPANDHRWVVSGLESFEVPLEFVPVEGRPEILRAIPGQRFEPGLYALEYASGAVRINARFGVRWPSAEQREWSAATCVDRYRGETTQYHHCSEQQQVLTARWLKLYLVNPDVESALRGRNLVIKGVVVNTSNKYQTIPLVEAQLRTRTGEVLQHWTFDTGTTGLPPGQSTTFRTRADNPPVGAHSVYVRFAGPPAALPDPHPSSSYGRVDPGGMRM
jgi:hypothetical protein